MSKIFVPEDNVYNKCYVVQSEGVIRAYDRVPSNNTNYNYRDYYVKSDYIYKDGSGNWSQYTTLPVCLNSSDITNDFYYRVDLTNILLNVLIISIFGILIPLKILAKLVFKGGL